MTVLIVEGARAETATTGNLLPNAGTGQTSVQHDNSTVDGITSATGFTLDGVTDFTQYNELEAQGTGTVSATGTLLDISAGNHTTTADSLDGGVTLTSRTEVQNCEWTGSSYQCGTATQGQDSYSTTVNILDEDENVLATVTQNRNTDAGYYNNTHTYTDTITHTGEGARKWEWEWTGIDGYKPDSQDPVGPNLLGAELKATLLDIFYSPIPPAIKTEMNEVFEDIGEEFEEIQQIVEEFFFEEEKIEMKEEFKEPPMIVMQEEEKFEEEPIFEEFVMIKEEKEEKPPVVQMVQMMKEEEKEEEEEVFEMIETFTEEEEKPKEEKTTSELLQEGFKEEQEQNEEEEISEEESNSDTTESADAEESDNQEQKETVRSKETKTVGLETVLDKIDEKIKDIDKNLKLKNLVKLKVMSSNNLLDAYNIPFYEPRIIYEDQINIQDDRIIYKVDLVEYKQNDPINKKNQQLNSILQERQKLIQELQVLQNG